MYLRTRCDKLISRVLQSKTRTEMKTENLLFTELGSLTIKKVETKKDLNDTRNALVVANNEIVELKQTINDMKEDNQEYRMFNNKNSSLNLIKTVLPFLVKNIINMSKKGKTEMEILKKAEDYIERLKNVK